MWLGVAWEQQGGDEPERVADWTAHRQVTLRRGFRQAQRAFSVLAAGTNPLGRVPRLQMEAEHEHASSSAPLDRAEFEAVRARAAAALATAAATAATSPERALAGEAMQVGGQAGIRQHGWSPSLPRPRVGLLRLHWH